MMDRLIWKSFCICVLCVCVGVWMDVWGGENDGKVYYVEMCVCGGCEMCGG